MTTAADARGTGPAVVAFFAVVAVVATFTNAPGEVVADARLEHFTEPAQFLARHADIWDDQRTLGEPSKYFSPVLAAFQSLIAATGAPAWVVERSTHALLLAVGATGTWALCRAVFGRRGWAWGAGLIYAFGPYSSQYLLPSGLYSAYAVAPWLALAAWRGTRARGRWPAAAAFALVVFSVGMLNTPALVLACAPALAMMILRMGLDGTWRDGFGWAWRTVVLTVAVSLPMLVTLSAARESIAANLESTETPEIVGFTSSAGESLRGLGFWLTYFRFGSGAFRSNVDAYFTSGVVIAASFAAVVLAAVAVAVDANRRTGALAVLAGFATVLMVGLHPIGDPSPIGRLIGEAFDASTLARGFRSTYKAGSSLQLAVALLAAAAVGVMRDRLATAALGRRRGAAAVAVVGLAALVVAAFPFATGRLYPRDERYGTIPDHWTEAFTWFDAQPHDDAVFVLPSLARTPYRWGYVNDTLFDGLLPQRAVSARTLPQSTRVLAELTEHLDDYANSRSSSAASLVPALRRMGVRWVLLQNDVDWQSAGVARPSAWDSLRADPGLRIAATFGERGAFTVGAPEADERYDAERRLPPIEVYEIVDAPEAGPFITRAPLVVAGGGEAWPGLAADGWLATPVRYLADVDLEDPDAFADTNRLIFTDGGRRRATRVVSSRSEFSHVLAGGADARTGTERRSARPLFDDPADQTVAQYGDAAAVTATSHGPALSVWDAVWRPANAIDGDARTAWATGLLGQQTLRIELTAGIDDPVVTIEPWVGDEGADRLDGYRVALFDADGDAIATGDATGPDRDGRYRFAADGASSVAAIEATIVGDDDSDAMVGIAEVGVEHAGGTLATDEVLRVPGPIDEADERLLIAAIDAAPDLSVHHRFVRSQRGADFAEESTIARRFWAPAGPVDLRLDVRFDDETPDETIAALLGASVTATAPSRLDGSLDAAAINAIDRNVGTAWQFAPDRPADLTITTPPTRIDEVELWNVSVGSLPFRLARMSRFDVVVTTGDGVTETFPVELDTEPDCDEAFADAGIPCIERVVVAIDPPIVASEIVVRPRTIDVAGSQFSQLPVQIAEVVLRDEGIDLDTLPRADRACRTLVDVDGRPVAFAPTAPVSFASLRDGVPWSSCTPVDLTAGWHDIDAASTTAWALNRIAIDPSGPAGGVVPVAPPRRVPDSWTRTGGRRQITTQVDAGEIVVTAIADHPGWSIAADGIGGVRLSVDGRVAWRADATGTVRLDVRYGPQQRYRWAWSVAAATIALCVWLLVPGRRRSPNPDAAAVATEGSDAVEVEPHDESTRQGGRPATATTGAVLVAGNAALGWLIAATPGLAAGVVLGALAARGSRRIGAVSVALVTATMVATLVEAPLDVDTIRRFPVERPVAHVLGLITAMSWIAAGWAAWLQSRPTTAPETEEEPCDPRRRAPLLLVALVVGFVATARVLVA